ncbi:hypothetical protein [Curtobacterium sp. ME12]|uniref:hypothetical protein n=1 Tax=Curtobacterium sp. ME12 TaxID=2744253 RepID=UPI0015F6EDD0|nr:hypothetical protein [Curtobacterium sp. ME12]
MRTIIAPRGYEPLYRNTLEQLQWTTSTTKAPFGATRLLLQRPARTHSDTNALFERRAERALARIAALEQHPARTAFTLHLTGSAISFSMLTISILSAIAGQPLLAPVFIGAAAWMVAAIAAPSVRVWRTRRVQHGLHAEYQALRVCTLTQRIADTAQQPDQPSYLASAPGGPTPSAKVNAAVVLQSQ